MRDWKMGIRALFGKNTDMDSSTAVPAEENPMSEEIESVVGSTAEPAEHKKKKRKRAAGIVSLSLAAALVTAAAAICTAATVNDTIFSGTSVLGVDMSGMTEAQAQKTWDDADACGGNTVALHWLTTDADGAEAEEELSQVTLKEMGASVTGKAAARAAWELCHGGNVFENGWALVRSWFRSTDVVPEFTVDTDALAQRSAALAEELNCTVVNGAWRLAEDGLYLTKPMDGRKMNAGALARDFAAHLDSRDLSPVVCEFDAFQARQLDIPALYEELKGGVVDSRYDRETGKPSPSHIGVAFDVEAVQQELDQAPEGREFLTSAQVEFPRVSQEFLEEGMFRDVLGTCTTYVSGTWARRTNVRLAAEKVNGCIYNPGEEFWYNATVGQRTEARGFQAAPAYYQGHTIDEVGGGICQVSSTLYYATLLSDLKIVQRWEHQFAPAYITFGCDATVSWNGPDYAFRNNTDYPIKIVTSYSDDNNLTCTIYGTKTDEGYVKMESYTRSVKGWDTVYQSSFDVPPGEQIVSETPYTGYLVETYRCHYDKDDNLIDRVYEAKSDYYKRDKVILVNPSDPVLY